MKDFWVREMEDEDLVGDLMGCEVEDEEVERNGRGGKMVKFVGVGDKEGGDGFEEERGMGKKERKGGGGMKGGERGDRGKKGGFEVESLLG